MTATREQTSYLLEATRGASSRAIDILGEILSRPELRHWEIHDSEPRLKFDLDVYDETAELRLVDMIHQASFRSGLSNTLYAPRYNLGNIHADTLQQYRARNFTLDRLTLVGVGIKHDDMLRVGFIGCHPPSPLHPPNKLNRTSNCFCGYRGHKYLFSKYDRNLFSNF